MSLEGKISAQWTDELARVCQSSLRNFRDVTLDLSGVTYVDERGVALLLDLQRRNVEITNCSNLVDFLLKGGM